MSFINAITDRFSAWLISLGFSHSTAEIIEELIFLLIVLAAFFIIDRLTIRYGRSWTDKVVSKTRFTWDDILNRHNVYAYLIRLVPALLFLYAIDFFFENIDTDLLRKLTRLYMLYLFVRGSFAALEASEEIYKSRRKPGSVYTIKPFLQVFQIVIMVTGALITLSILISEDILVIIGGLGAFAAILVLVFKDSILGFVGGLQISINDMLRHGDWISIPQFDVDGTVVDISLTTVKVQNWDKTISTVPTYSFVTESFKNWRGMKESGGRRIKRFINIDMSSIKVCTPALFEKLKKTGLLRDYIESRESEIRSYNEQLDTDEEQAAPRQQTNIGIFRAYITRYLRTNDQIHQNMTFIIRQLQPTTQGLPIEIYVFSKTQKWSEFEDLQSEIFDHLLAKVPLFELRVFQRSSDADAQEAFSNELD